MIIIAGTYVIDPADLDEARSAAAAMMGATAQEAGCLEYVFSDDITAPGTMKLFERWTDDDALAAHFTTPHMATFRAALGKIQLISRHVTIWRDVSDGEPLG